MSEVSFRRWDEAIGNIVVKRRDEIEIEWEIEDFFIAAEKKNIRLSPRFSFMETPWYLRLMVKTPISGCMRLSIWKMERFERAVEYNFGLKRRDGVVEHFSKDILEEKKMEKSSFINLLEIQQRKSELVPSDKLIIVCYLKLETTHTDKQKMWASAKVNKLIKLDVLSENLKDLFANKDSCDTVLEVKDKEFKVHKAILMGRSPVFAAMFQHDTLEKHTGFVKIPDCDPESFQEFLDYLYCGKLEDISYSSAFQLYITSSKYDVQKLKDFCVECLAQNFTVDNMCDIVILADKYSDEKLMAAAQHFFNENWSKIFVTTEWKSLLKNDYRLVDKLLTDLSKAKGSH